MRPALALLALLVAGCGQASPPKAEPAPGQSERAQAELASAARQYGAAVDIWRSLGDGGDNAALQSALELLADAVERVPRPGSVATTEAAKLIREDASK